MSALELKRQNDTSVSYSAHVGWTIASLIFAIVGSMVGLFIFNIEYIFPFLRPHFKYVRLDLAFILKKILSIFKRKNKSKISSEITPMNNIKPDKEIDEDIYQKFEINVPLLILATVFITAGVLSMHYTGMHAIIGEFTIKHTWYLVMISCFVALFTACVALIIVRIVRSLLFQIISALVMGLAVCATHYSGMAAVYYVPESTNNHGLSFTLGALTVITTVVGGTTCFIVITLIAASMRRERVITQKVLERMKIYNKYLPKHLREEIYKNKKKPIAKNNIPSSDEDKEVENEIEDESHNSMVESASELSTSISAKTKQSSIKKSDKKFRINKDEIQTLKSTIMYITLQPKTFDNDYFEIHSRIVTYLENNLTISKGVLRKFSEKEFICEYNTIKPCLNHPRKCLQTATSISKYLESFKIPFSIGISTGIVRVGSVGNNDSKSEVVFGDAFDTALMLSKLGFIYNKNILLTNNSYTKHEKRQFVCSPVDIGVFLFQYNSTQFTIYELIGSRVIKNDEWLYEREKVSEIDAHDEASIIFEFLFADRWKDAIPAIESYCERYPKNSTTTTMSQILGARFTKKPSFEENRLATYRSILRPDLFIYEVKNMQTVNSNYET